MFNDGALTDARNLERLDEMRDRISDPMTMEIIRWGNSLETPAVWNAEVDWLRNEFLANRWSIQLNQFKEAGLYSSFVCARISC